MGEGQEKWTFMFLYLKAVSYKGESFWKPPPFQLDLPASLTCFQLRFFKDIFYSLGSHFIKNIMFYYFSTFQNTVLRVVTLPTLILLNVIKIVKVHT